MNSLPKPRREGLALCYLQLLLKPAVERGLDADALLKRCGIPPLPPGGPLYPVPLTQFARALRLLQHELRDEMFALTARPLRPGTFALVTKQMLACPTLGDAIRLGSSLYRLSMSDLQLRLRVDQSDAILSVIGRSASTECCATAHMVLLYGAIGLMSWMVRRHIPLREVSLPGQLSGCETAPPLFEERFRVGHTGQIRFDKSWLDSPIAADIKGLRNFLLYWPVRRLPPNEEALPFSIQVRRHLRLWDIGRLPSLQELASAMKESPRTLRRRLSEEGQSYRSIIDNLRCTEALRLMDQAQLTISEVGYRLGFSEPSAFHRAFKRCTGQTPMAYRQARLSRLSDGHFH